ncbi:MAG: DNA internalization-related competence protein ComEC/Rec2 [Candidatus Bathyarchaeia archaeon]
MEKRTEKGLNSTVFFILKDFYFKSPFSPLCASLVTGMLLANCEWLFFCVSAFISLLGLFCISKKVGAKACFLALIFAALGYWNASKILNPKLGKDHISQLSLEEITKVEGYTFKPSDLSMQRTTIYLEVKRAFVNNKWIKVKGRLKLNYRGKLQLNQGAFIRVKVKLRKPTGYFNPGSFQYHKYLQRQGILVIGSALSPPEILNTSKSTLTLIREHYLYALSFASPKTRGILKALILGQRDEILQDVRELFQITGVSHILAVSGIHVSVLFLFSTYFVKIILKWLHINISKNILTFLSLPLVWGYIYLVGGPPSALRAGLMFTTTVFLVSFYRPFSAVNNLFIAAFFILLINPSSLWTPSFQLSFAATSGILLLAPRVSTFIDKLFIDYGTSYEKKKISVRKTIKWFFSIIYISVIAQIFTVPILIAHFNHVSLIGPIANLAVVPIMSVLILPMSFIAAVFSLFSIYFAKTLIQISSLTLEIVLNILKIFAEISYLNLWVFSFNNIEYLCFYFTLILLLIFFRSKNLFWPFIIVISLLWGLYVFSQSEKSKELGDFKITFLDVGHGDSIFVQLPLGSTMLIDGGTAVNDFDTGRNIVAPFLWSQRVLKVDYVVLSHAEPDHYGGLLFILKNFKPKEFWYAGESLPDELVKVLNDLKKQGLVIRKLKRGDTMRVSGVDIFVLHPPENWSSDPNDSSLVLKIEKANRSILFTGDISKKVEIELLKSISELKAEVIKVPHHGSKYSSSYSFCQAVSPKIAIFSVGKNNPYGHPSEKIIQRYKGIGATILRTDTCGAITLTADDYGWRISTYLKCNLYP